MFNKKMVAYSKKRKCSSNIMISHAAMIIRMYNDFLVSPENHKLRLVNMQRESCKSVKN